MRLYGQDVSTGTERGVVVPVGGVLFFESNFCPSRITCALVYISEKVKVGSRSLCCVWVLVRGDSSGTGG